MTLETFFDKFDQFADAPDALAKMRELVLNLAVQGKLVEQDPRDDSASELLERLGRELTPEQRRRQAAPLSPLPAESLQYEVPESWTWARFCDVAIVASNLVKPDEFLDFTHLAPDNIEKRNGVLLPCRTVREDKVISSNHRFYPGQIVYSKIRPNLAKVVVVDFDGLCSADMYPIDALIDAFYLQRYMLSESFLVQAVKTDTRVAMPKINQTELNAIAVPVPPLAEQKRIVAKVDELMALCDRLEAQQQEREEQASKLARASLARFADAPTPANLNFIFHSSFSIHPSDLRNSILTLAVQGKLVPQDSNDEPADSILQDTHSLFDRLIAAKELSAPKPLPPIEDDEVPFSLPIGWAWYRFGQIMRIASGDGLVAKDMNAGPIPVYGGNGVNGYHDAHNVAKRTLVIGRVGFYCGSIHVTPERAWVTDNAFITTFDEEHVDMDFLSWLLKATDLRERDNATAQPVISGGKVYPTVLPLPPLAEQRRIVAKVEQLMALVDALETQLAASRATAANLLSALVAELTGSPPRGKISVPSGSSTGRPGRPRKSF